MEKSRNDQLTNDGLSTLKYKKLNEKLEPTHTWILVKLPPPPPKHKKTLWELAKKRLWSGMEKVGGGVAKTISDKATDMAEKKEKRHEQLLDNVY